MNQFRGVFTALITPFKNNKIDFQSLEKLVKFQLENGVDGFVVNGTTAESPNLSSVEREEIFKKVKQWSGSDIPIILGTGSNSTEKTIADTQRAALIGADAALVVVPYYNKPPQRGLEQHFCAIAKSAKIPIILYNVPGRTITSLDPSTVEKISHEENVIGIKEATGDMNIAREIKKLCGNNFTLLSGDDATYVEFLANGGHGVISVATHILPKLFSDWTKKAQAGSFESSRQEIKKHLPLIEALFIEANPIPVKKALQMMGIIESAECRLPLVEMELGLQQKLKTEMTAAGIL
jgi:4-hydroxy-tetrahydrodipicolinate synthase